MATNTTQEQQVLQAKIDLAYVEVKKVFDEKKEINRQLKGLDLTEAERNALQARRLQLDDQGDLLFRDISSTEGQLNRLTKNVSTGANPPVSTLNNQPIPASSNQNTGGSSSTTAGRYQQAVADDQVRLNNLNQQLINSDAALANNRSREAELTQILRNNPEGSPEYQAALAERATVRRQNLDLENQQISLRQDISVRQNSLATNTNQLNSITTETALPTVPPPEPTLVTNPVGTPVSDDNLAFEQSPDDNLAFQDTEVDDTDGYIVPDGTINVPESQREFAPTALGGNFSAQYDVESGTYGVFDEDTGQFVQTGLSEQEATILAQDASVGDPSFAGNADAFGGDTGVPASEVAFAPTALGGDFVAAFDPETGTWGVFDNETGVFVETGLTEQEATLKAQEYSIGDPNFAGNADAFGGDPGLTPEQAQAQAQEQAEADAARAAIEQAARERARIAQAIEAQRRQANEGDWRVKLRLAGGADYLYRDPNINKDGILWPLSVTDGVIFPYTPVITTNYMANYNPYDLTHSNYRGYFYQNSTVDEITIQALFTAQDTTEANYMLAVIHFFRSVTKMFYGQDPNRGQPPPLVFLQGLGEFQFNLHPCVVRSFTYSMPNDIDYIRARTANFDGTSLLKRRDRQTQSLAPFNASAKNLENSGLPAGAERTGQTVPTLGTNAPTYVPTRLETTITLLPMQTRQQVSREFSLRDYANGELVKRGFW